MSITYAKNACLIKTPPQVEILGRLYRTVKIGNVEIMAEDLEGAIGTTGAYGDSIEVNGSWFYHHSIDTYLQDIKNEGWDYLNATFMSSILSTLGGSFNDAMKLLLYEGPNWPGTNEMTTALVSGDGVSNGGVIQPGSGSAGSYLNMSSRFYMNICTGSPKRFDYRDLTNSEWFLRCRLCRNV